ncbi:MAG: hydrolase [Methylococcales bacterium]
MEKFLFLDLDDTVFQTLRKCSETEALLPVAFLADGEAISYSTERQINLIEDLAANWRIIPTTARNRDAFFRVNLPVEFREGAILNHGAMIIDQHGAPDPVWHERMKTRLAPYACGFGMLERALLDFARRSDLPLKIRVIKEDEKPFYIVVKHRQADSDALKSVRDDCVKPFFSKLCMEVYPHLNDNNLAILPAPVNKAHAVAFLIERLRDRYGEIMTMGMGDSLTDIDFIALCDYAMIPGRTQLHAALCARGR